MRKKDFKKDLPALAPHKFCHTHFIIVIGSLGTYLSCNQQMITWVSNYRGPI